MHKAKQDKPVVSDAEFIGFLIFCVLFPYVLHYIILL